jgi:hypothetical protein
VYVALLVRWRLPGADVSCNGSLRYQVAELPYLSSPLSRSAAVGGIAFAAVCGWTAEYIAAVLVEQSYSAPDLTPLQKCTAATLGVQRFPNHSPRSLR